MEQMFLTAHGIILKKQGIPLNLIHHLVKANRFHDVNLRSGYGRDTELDEINRMEENLGTLNPDLIEQRIAADFCCIWRYDYPERIREICSIIGGSPHIPLRLHYQISQQRRQDLIDYAESLKGWLTDKTPDDFSVDSSATVRKVYKFLGKKEHLKKMLVERTYYGLSQRSLNCSFWGNNDPSEETPLYPYNAQELASDWSQRMTSLEKNIQKEMGSAAYNFLCDVGGSAEPACHFKFMRRIDILVSSIGCLQWRGNLPPKDQLITGRRQLTRLYLDILASYWNGEKSEPMNNHADTLKTELFSLLGKPDDTRKWLVACLWKNIKNQTSTQAYPMRHWVEFVRIGEAYIQKLDKKKV